jgi:hypothetical protein
VLDKPSPVRFTDTTGEGEARPGEGDTIMTSTHYGTGLEAEDARRERDAALLALGRAVAHGDPERIDHAAHDVIVVASRYGSAEDVDLMTDALADVDAVTYADVLRVACYLREVVA